MPTIRQADALRNRSPAKLKVTVRPTATATTESANRPASHTANVSATRLASADSAEILVWPTEAAE